MSRDIQQHQQYKILIIGEACSDVYVFGDVERLSPEAPVPVIKSTNTERKEGMSENVAKNIQAMSPKAIVTKCQNKFDKIKKTRFIDNKSKYQMLRYDTEEELIPLKVKDIPDQNYDAIVISDYNKGYLSNRVITEIFERFNDCRIFVDTKREDRFSC
jgi:bifunctional ADP-heptose synthase (sugar kinase/adenylyltransferase)